jgi:hypothetical protein
MDVVVSMQILEVLAEVLLYVFLWPVILGSFEMSVIVPFIILLLYDYFLVCIIVWILKMFKKLKRNEYVHYFFS